MHSEANVPGRDGRNRLTNTVGAAVGLTILAGTGWLPTLLIGAIAVVIVVFEARRGDVEHGLRVASIEFLPVLVALERGAAASDRIAPGARPVMAELGVWGVLLVVGVFVPRPTPPERPRGARVPFSDSAAGSPGERGADAPSAGLAEVIGIARGEERPEAA